MDGASYDSRESEISRRRSAGLRQDALRQSRRNEVQRDSFYPERRTPRLNHTQEQIVRRFTRVCNEENLRVGRIRLDPLLRYLQPQTRVVGNS
jgi:hypothetical protein